VKKLIRISTVVLLISGLLLIPVLYQKSELLTGIHIALGFVYIVLFLLFSVDHISGHKQTLTEINLKNGAGLIQILVGVIILISGFILYLFGSLPLSPWTEIHLIGTLIYLTSTGIHLFIK
jgi:hypothetical protein